MIACALVAAMLISTPAHAQELTRPPRLVRFVEASPPEGGGESSVVLFIDIGADGEVIDVSVAESGGGAFDAAAIAAARQFKFEPAEVEGVPTPIRIQYRYTFTETVELPPPTTTLSGTLRLRSGEPVAGATVALSAADPQTTTTDAGGRFAFIDVPPGVYEVAVSGPSFVPLRSTEVLEVGESRTVAWTLEPIDDAVDEELVLRAPRRIASDTRIGVRAEEARKIPGTQGDLLKVVQSLPGVAQAAGGSANLVVWGAAPEDTRVVVDGVEIPALYHLGGVRSTINSALVESIELVPAAFGAPYGRGLGGLVRVTTRHLPADAPAGYLAADLYGASGELSVPVGGRVRAAAAGRVGTLDRLFPALVDDEVEELFSIPRYYDLQLRTEADLRRDEWVGLTFLHSSDSLERSAAERREQIDSRFSAIYLSYNRILPNGASFTATPHALLIRHSRRARFGPTPADLLTDTTRLGLRASYREAVDEHVTLVLGVDALGDATDVERVGSLNRPPREGDVSVFGQPPGDDVSADAFGEDTVDFGAHLEAEVTVGPVSVVPGLRADVFLVQGDRLAPPIGESPRIGFGRLELAFDPRLAVRWAVTDGVALHAATGRYHQAPRPEDLSAVFGNPALELSSALHAVTGASLALDDATDLEVTGFWEDFSSLVARSPSPNPQLARALTNDGRGRSFGAQLLLRRALAGALSGWFSYTLARSERVDFEGGPTRLFDFDQTHALSLALSQDVGAWSFGARARYTTGFPRTPVIGAFFDARNDRFQPIFGAHNSERMPDFFQLDLRVEYRVPLPIGALSAYVDVQNVTNRTNAEEIIYNFDYSEPGFVQGLPTLAIVGARYDL